MKKVLLTAGLLGLFGQAHAFNEKQAVELVKKYVGTVACAYDESTFPVAKIDNDSYVVGWTGQLGCPGGNQTTLSYLSVVSPGYHGEDTYIVDYRPATADITALETVDKLAFQKGTLSVTGSGMTLKFVREGFKWKKVR
jgi:hypothetical protein